MGKPKRGSGAPTEAYYRKTLGLERLVLRVPAGVAAAFREMAGPERGALARLFAEWVEERRGRKRKG